MAKPKRNAKGRFVKGGKKAKKARKAKGKKAKKLTKHQIRVRAGKKAARTRARNAKAGRFAKGGKKVAKRRVKKVKAKKIAKKAKKAGRKGRGVVYCQKCPKVLVGGKKALATHNRRHHKGGK